MKRLFLLSGILFCLADSSFSQNVGIGTNTPNPKAILDIKATGKGILFPRMTTAQRNTITSPPDGLHIFNTDDHCLNYYDSAYGLWNCYCSNCQTVIIEITDDICNVDFYNQYARYSPAKKYIINLHEDIYIYGCQSGDTAISFTGLPVGTSIVINNYGGILGAGGKGGNGQIEPGCTQPFPVFAEPGQAGGAAILTKAGVTVTVNNYGVVAGGGGGGGGSTKGSSAGYGGGGGGGAGLLFGPGGAGGGTYTQTCGQLGCSPCIPTILAQPGATGTNLVGGAGGAGNNGGPPGGNGGGRAQAGQTGNIVPGGAGGKAIAGGSGNTIVNIGVGQSYGIVD